MNEQLEILRRIAERMKAMAEAPPADPGYLDYANHLLAEIQATKTILAKQTTDRS